MTPFVYGSLPSIAADADLTTAYSTWKSRRFKTITCLSQPMAYVDNGRGYNQVFSEGQAYGLLMAAYNDASSVDFTKLWKFYEMRMDSRGLMNWEGPSDCTGNNGANAATDADLDAAIALIRAHRRWPAEGWGAKATTLLNNIYANMVDGCQGLKNGDTWGGCSSGANNAYNPSYFRTAYMASFNCFEGSSRWTAVRNRSYTLMNTAYSSYALPPDWVRNDGSWGQATNSGGYGYDSCRSPWTFAQDYLWWGNTNGQNWGKKIAYVFGNKSGGWSNPASAASDVGDDYSYSSGAKVRGNHENAFIGGAAVAFMATTNTAQLNAFYNELKFTDNNSYYSDSLKVIYLMLLTGVFQEPCYGPGPIPTATPTATPTTYAGTPTQTPMPAFGLVFEDFENGITGNYGYPAAIQSVQSRSASAAHAGAYGYSVGPANLASGGVGFNSSYANGSGVIDATGSVSLRFWVKSDANITFQVDWYEAGATGAPVAGGDGEAWVSANQNVSAGSGWQQIVIPIVGMTEEIYNGACNPTYATPGNCPTTGNNTMNLSAVRQIQIKFTLGASATVYFDDFEFVLGTQPSPTSTRTPFIGSYNQVFDDMETTTSLRPAPVPAYAGTYADSANGASASITKSTAVLAPGGGSNTTSGMLTYNTGTGTSYGAGGWLLSPYTDSSLIVDASGAVFVGFWINAPAGLAYRVEFTEAGSPTSITAGAEGEAYQSSLLVADGGWEFVQLEVGTFSEDLYNPLCNPTGSTPANCTSTGDGVKDFQGIASFSFKLDGNQGSGVLYFDDIVFVTSYKSPTPTRTYTTAPTASPTATPSRTASPSATGTPSPSPTRTATPSASPSVTPSITVSFSASPTETTYAGSPTNTPLASPTPTTTPAYDAWDPTDDVLAGATDVSAPLPAVHNSLGHFIGYGSDAEDWYKIDVMAGRTYGIGVTGASGGIPVLAAFDGSMNAIVSGPGSLSFTAQFSGWVYVRLTPSAPTPYDLSSGDLGMTTATPSRTVTYTYSVTPSVTQTYSTVPSASLTRTGTPGTIPSGSPTFTPSPAGPTLTFSLTATPLPGTPSVTRTPTPGAPTSTPSSTPTPMIQDFGFTWSPSQLTVTAGTTVTWGWVGFHDLRSDTSLWTAVPAQNNGSFAFTFNAPGSYRYYCGLHGNVGGVGMSGIIYVVGAATATPVPASGGTQVILKTASFPNPVSGRGGSIRVQLDNAVDGLVLKVYTTSMIQVGSLELGAQNAGWVDMALPASILGQPAGAYFYVVTAKRNGQPAKAPKSGRLVLLH